MAGVKLLPLLLLGVGVPVVAPTPGRPQQSCCAAQRQRLRAYEDQLSALRRDFGGGAIDVPPVPFYVFGMGPRREKLLYKRGRLFSALTNRTLREWDVASELIVPCDYAVHLNTTDSGAVSIVEDERGVWLSEGQGAPRRLASGGGAGIRLPSFAGLRYGLVLRVLHQELLVNVLPSGPTPNLVSQRFARFHHPQLKEASRSLCTPSRGGATARS